jgi:hypothetical protein
VKHEFALADANGMAGVVTALVARDDVEVRREDIYDLAFAFVAPLGSDYDYVFHGNSQDPRSPAIFCFLQTEVQAHTLPTAVCA